MLTLGISTSAKYPSAAVSRDGVLLSFRIDESGRSHSQTLMTLIDSAITDAGIQKSELELIAVDVGPGSFTGVRIGVSTANAMAMALGIGVMPICSLAALRHVAAQSGAVAVIIDARNGNGYAAIYQNGTETTAPCPCVIADIVNSAPVDTTFVGDCLGYNDHCDARLVLCEAASVKTDGECNCIQKDACPLYLRPSQAERKKTL